MAEPHEDPDGRGRESGSGRGLEAWRWPLAIVAVALIGVLGGLVVFLAGLRQVDKAGAGAADLARRAAAAAEGLTSARITETFVASLPELDASGVGRLELATLQATETFTRSDERLVLWDTVSLGTTVAEIRVPVTYRYHVRLEDPWRLEVGEDGLVRVWAPAIRASQPPAIHTDGMQKRVDVDWLRWDGQEQLDVLQSTITPTLVSMAQHPLKIAAVRDRSRETVARFVRTFLLGEGLWGPDRIVAVQVLFEGEEPDPEKVEVSIRWSERPEG